LQHAANCIFINYRISINTTSKRKGRYVLYGVDKVA